jgi:hypothetical protein
LKRVSQLGEQSEVSKFQRLLKAAENEVDPLDRSVILTFESATTIPTGLQKRWPNEAPMISNPTLQSMAYLVEDRILSAKARGAQSTQVLFEYLASAINRIRGDDALLSDTTDWPGA